MMREFVFDSYIGQSTNPLVVDIVDIVNNKTMVTGNNANELNETGTVCMVSSFSLSLRLEGSDRYGFIFSIITLPSMTYYLEQKYTYTPQKTLITH